MQKPIGTALKEARERAGLSQTAVSRRVNLAVGQLSKIESGQSVSPEFGTVARIASIIGVSLDSLASESGYVKSHQGGDVATLIRRLTLATEKIESALRGQGKHCK